MVHRNLLKKPIQQEKKALSLLYSEIVIGNIHKYLLAVGCRLEFAVWCNQTFSAASLPASSEHRPAANLSAANLSSKARAPLSLQRAVWLNVTIIP